MAFWKTLGKAALGAASAMPGPVGKVAGAVSGMFGRGGRGPSGGGSISDRLRDAATNKKPYMDESGALGGGQGLRSMSKTIRTSRSMKGGR